MADFQVCSWGEGAGRKNVTALVLLLTSALPYGRDYPCAGRRRGSCFGREADDRNLTCFVNFNNKTPASST